MQILSLLLLPNRLASVSNKQMGVEPTLHKWRQHNNWNILQYVADAAGPYRNPCLLLVIVSPYQGES
jgi:hypothetical protein